MRGCGCLIVACWAPGEVPAGPCSTIAGSLLTAALR